MVNEAESRRATIATRFTPDEDPDSLAAAKAALGSLKRTKVMPAQDQIHSLKVPWIEAHVKFWDTLEKMKQAAAVEKDIEFCLQHNLLDMAQHAHGCPRGRKYAGDSLCKKSVDELRTMCMNEGISVKEPLFGKHKYMMGLLAEVQAPPVGGMQGFVNSKRTRVQVLREELSLHKQRIVQCKARLDAAKHERAAKEQKALNKILSVAAKKEAFMQRTAMREAAIAQMRAANEEHRLRSNQARRAAESELIRARRRAARERATETCQMVADEVQTDACAPHLSIDAFSGGTWEDASASKAGPGGSTDCFSAPGGTWVVIVGPDKVGHRKREYVSVLDAPAEEARVMGYMLRRQRFESTGVVTNAHGEWLRVASPANGYVRLMSDGEVKDKGKIGENKCTRTVERVIYHVGVNGYSMCDWRAAWDELLNMKRLQGDTLLYSKFVPQRNERNEVAGGRDAAGARVQEGGELAVLFEWVCKQRELFQDGLLPAACVAAMDTEGFEWDDSKPFLFAEDAARQGFGRGAQGKSDGTQLDSTSQAPATGTSIRPVHVLQWAKEQLDVLERHFSAALTTRPSRRRTGPM